MTFIFATHFTLVTEKVKYKNSPNKFIKRTINIIYFNRSPVRHGYGQKIMLLSSKKDGIWSFGLKKHARGEKCCILIAKNKKF